MVSGILFINPRLVDAIPTVTIPTRVLIVFWTFVQEFVFVFVTIPLVGDGSAVIVKSLKFNWFVMAPFIKSLAELKA